MATLKAFVLSADSFQARTNTSVLDFLPCGQSSCLESLLCTSRLEHLFKGTEMDPGVLNFGSRCEPGNQILIELLAINVAPVVSKFQLSRRCVEETMLAVQSCQCVGRKSLVI